MRALSAGLATLALAAGLAACGGDDDKGGDAASTTPAPTPKLLPNAGAAYRPTPAGAQTPAPPSGKRVADSGFDITTQGFAFANYGKTRGPQIRPDEVREIYGDGVCVSGGAGECVLTPDAERWRQMQNGMAQGGHCYGFATLALAMRRGVVDPSIYGGATAFDLRIADRSGNVTNPDLDADLTRSWAVQGVAAVQRKARKFTATEAVEYLRKAFAAGDNNYVLSFFFPGVGGHAVIPTAIEDMGGGVYDILLYDNNFPYVPGDPHQSDRRMHIDTNKDRWDYTVSLNPDEPEGKWYGVGFDNPLELVRSEDQQLPQACPFCDNAPRAARTTVGLDADPVDHGRIKITDVQGRVTGWNGSKVVNEIPGAQVRRQRVINRQLVEPEPFYELPSGRAYSIEYVDVPSGAPAATVNVVGPDVGVGVSRLTGDGARLSVSATGAVALDQGTPAGPEPEVSLALGDKTVRVVPDSDRVKLVPRGEDGLRIDGQVQRAVAKDAATGDTETVPTGTRDTVQLGAG